MSNGLFMSHYMTKPIFLALHTVRLSLISVCVSAKSVKRNLSALYEKLKVFFMRIVKTGQTGRTLRLIRVFVELIALSVCFLIFQSFHVMEQTERSDALIHRHNYLKLVAGMLNSAKNVSSVM